MSKLSDNAVEHFSKGYNCSQIVLGSFYEKYGMKQEQAFAMATGLGGGARFGEICGAVSGGILVVGLKYGKDKPLCYQRTTEFINEFRSRRGNIVCRELLGCDIGKPEVMKRAAESGLFKKMCPIMIREAVEILEEMGY